MAGGTNQWPPEGGMGRPGFAPGGPNDPAMGGSGYYRGGQGGGWGGDYGFKAKKAVMPEGWQSGDPNPWNPGGSPAYEQMTGGGWGGPTQWAGPNAHYPNWNDDPSSGYANDVAVMQEGGGWGDGGWRDGYQPFPPGTGGGPWTGGGGGFGPGLMSGGDDSGYYGGGWQVFDGPGSGMWGEEAVAVPQPITRPQIKPPTADTPVRKIHQQPFRTERGRDSA